MNNRKYGAKPEDAIIDDPVFYNATAQQPLDCNLPPQGIAIYDTRASRRRKLNPQDNALQQAAEGELEGALRDFSSELPRE